jgi:hypothetical protein
MRLVPVSDKPGEPRTDWDTHVVLSEAAAHFEDIAEREDDKARIAALKYRLDMAPPRMYITPIFVPLEAKADVSAMIERKSKVAFDFSGQGAKM